MKTSIVLSTHPSKFDAVAFKGDFAANVATIAALGYDGVELAIRDPNLIQADVLLAVTNAHGLAVPAIGTGQAWGEEGLSFTDPDPGVRAAAVQRVLDHIPFAARTGAVIIIGLLRGIVRPGIAHAQAHAWMVKALQRCAAAAAPRGVRLALEPINRYETTLINSVPECLALVEEVGSSAFGVLADTFHMNIEDASIEESLREAGSHLFHVHFADSNRAYPGAGHIDFCAIVHTLRAIGYTGYISIEARPVPDAETCAVESMRTLRRLLDEA
ncbi:MAG: sugar phosphate isomerase/epimerase [Anaerolineae bacterium]|nr:sugar phosphate isomerase/epimerase [Anaerolineae bacterium]